MRTEFPAFEEVGLQNIPNDTVGKKKSKRKF